MKKKQKKTSNLFEWQKVNKKLRKQGKKPLTLLEWQTEHKNRKSNYAFPVAVSLFIFLIAIIMTRTIWFSMIIPSVIMLGTLGFALKERRDDKKAREKMSLPESERREKYLKNADSYIFESIESDSMHEDIIKHYRELKKEERIIGICLIAVSAVIGYLIFLAYHSDSEFWQSFIFKTPFSLICLVPPILTCIAIVVFGIEIKRNPEKIYADFYNKNKDDIMRIEHSYMRGKKLFVSGITLIIGSYYLIIENGTKVKAYRYDEITAFLYSERKKLYSEGVYSHDKYLYCIVITNNRTINDNNFMKTNEHTTEMLCDEFMRHGVKIEDKRRF